ncbi:hypothetical protein NDU88_010183 [Pleurodeles waltl]|uniref:Uncharacterized protein n=1 Tax=Pleurodeles waltl TaxID=8319 RepID=A0AAV7RY90_PLEWA|nr:hypothetical protein NDU88_010183 [Pleurodeles waltl]
MCKDRANKGTQQTRMDQYTAQSVGASLQKDSPGPLEKGAEPTGAHLLAAIQSSSRETQTQITAIAVDVNLLRADLKAAAVSGRGPLGNMLAWLLRRERPIPIIQMLCGPLEKGFYGQLRVNSHVREHLRTIYATPCGVGVPHRDPVGGIVGGAVLG